MTTNKQGGEGAQSPASGSLDGGPDVQRRRSISDIRWPSSRSIWVGTLGLIVLGIGWSVAHRHQAAEDAKNRNIFNASQAMLNDGVRADILELEMGSRTGKASLILGKGATLECFIDGATFKVGINSEGEVVDTEAYTFRVQSGDESNLVSVNNGKELAELLGPDPCVPGSSDEYPRPEGLR